MKRLRMFALLAPTLSLAIVAASAQTGGTTGKTGTPPPATTPQNKPVTTTTAAARGLQVHAASDVIGMKVTNAQNEKLGKIEDIVVTSTGEIAYAVLSFGGVMGVGDKYFAIPWSVLQMHNADALNGDGENALILPLDKERLKNAPGFDKSKWPVMTSSDWAKDIDTYYANDRRSTTGRPVEASARMDASELRASELKGMNVETPSGDKLGDIKEVALDPSGRVNFVVVSVGGFLGIGDRHVAVPWEAVKMTRESKSEKVKLVMNITKDRLEKAPQYTLGREHWNEMSDPAFVTRVYDFYNVRPYWSSSTTTPSGSDKGKDMDMDKDKPADGDKK